MWSAIVNKLKEIWKKMFSTNTLGDALNINIAPIISVPHNAGVKDNAKKAENAMETDITIAN